MKTFVWDQHFTIGLERVDEQHHRLVDLINRLGESLIAAADKAWYAAKKGGRDRGCTG